MPTRLLRLNVNGRLREVAAPDGALLLEVLRDTLALTGTKQGLRRRRVRRLHRAGGRRAPASRASPWPPAWRTAPSRPSRRRLPTAA